MYRLSEKSLVSLARPLRGLKPSRLLCPLSYSTLKLTRSTCGKSTMCIMIACFLFLHRPLFLPAFIEIHILSNRGTCTTMQYRYMLIIKPYKNLPFSKTTKTAPGVCLMLVRAFCKKL